VGVRIEQGMGDAAARQRPIGRLRCTQQDLMPSSTSAKYLRLEELVVPGQGDRWLGGTDPLHADLEPRQNVRAALFSLGRFCGT